jgi:butyryl-CoA dehydrogenase
MSWEDGFQFELDEDTRLVQRTAREFAASEVAPLARRIDKEHYFPKDLIPKLGELGFMGACVPAQYGGSELSQVAYCLIIEELAAVCASTSIIVSAHNSLCISPILEFGSEEQKRRYLPDLCSGKALGCFSLSEPNTGSDAAALTCSFKKVGADFIVNGTKNWVTNGPEAHTCVLFATAGHDLGYKGVTAFVLDMSLPGITRGKPEDKMGIRGSPTSSLTFTDVKLTPAHVLGAEGKGFNVAMNTLNGGRIGVAAQALGIARAALKDALAYAKERKAFGKIIGEHQSVQNYLADMVTKLDAARYLTLGAARKKDRGEKYAREAAMAKLFASETAMDAGIKGVQIHGGYGYVTDYPAERHMRDAKITEIYEGTSEIQRLVIASNLLKD